MPIYIVMLGAPGAGKGTQAEILSENMKLPHVSSGDIFRENIKNETELGKHANSFMNRGELVPDDVTIAMIRDRISRPDCKAGAILDGFPRTPTQAEALDEMLAEFDGKVDLVPFILVKDEYLIERLSSRWTCQDQGHIFNEKFNPPKETGICDFDGSELYQRDDDKPETVKNRIAVYWEQTSPLIEHYRSTGVLKDINGARKIENVAKELLLALQFMEEL